MKFKFEQTNEKEEVVAFGKTKNTLFETIETLCFQDEHPLIGYKNEEFKELNPLEIECFFTENEKVYTLINNQKYLLKKRLYELNELYGQTFTYINQGCLANLKFVEHFKVSIGGSIIVIFKSGYKDIVSRRQIKVVKERIGIK